jgi:hypothetical protein
MHKNGKNDAAYPWDQFVAGRSIEIERKKNSPFKDKKCSFFTKTYLFLKIDLHVRFSCLRICFEIAFDGMCGL